MNNFKNVKSLVLRESRHGFTLIELAIATAILAVLAIVFFPALGPV